MVCIIFYFFHAKLNEINIFFALFIQLKWTCLGKAAPILILYLQLYITTASTACLYFEFKFQVSGTQILFIFVHKFIRMKRYLQRYKPIFSSSDYQDVRWGLSFQFQFKYQLQCFPGTQHSTGTLYKQIKYISNIEH